MPNMPVREVARSTLVADGTIAVAAHAVVRPPTSGTTTLAACGHCGQKLDEKIGRRPVVTSCEYKPDDD